VTLVVDKTRTPYVSPLRANDFANLPRTLLICAEIDPLLNDGLEYAGRLARERVPIELEVYAAMFTDSGVWAAFWTMHAVPSTVRVTG
jgi:acetyl esterase/lipase